MLILIVWIVALFIYWLNKIAIPQAKERKAAKALELKWSKTLAKREELKSQGYNYEPVRDVFIHEITEEVISHA